MTGELYDQILVAAWRLADQAHTAAEAAWADYDAALSRARCAEDAAIAAIEAARSLERTRPGGARNGRG